MELFSSQPRDERVHRHERPQPDDCSHSRLVYDRLEGERRDHQQQGHGSQRTVHPQQQPRGERRPGITHRSGRTEQGRHDTIFGRQDATPRGDDRTPSRE